MMSGSCEECGAAAEFCDRVPRQDAPGESRFMPLCWIHACQRRQLAGSRINPVLVYEGVGYLDFDRASGLCECPECGRRYYDHPPFKFAPYLNQLCDGSLVKL